eukprot:scaffold55459_cov60-Phaeocystis_antarctica.AAC.3
MSSAGGHCPLMMRLTVSLSLHSATPGTCFEPPSRSSRAGLLERRLAAHAAACRVAHELRRGASSDLPLPPALPPPPPPDAVAGRPAAVGGVRLQPGQACSWLLHCAPHCAPP